MSISGVGSQSSLAIQSLVDMRTQLDDLQRQLGTGKKAVTYAGMGIDRGFAVGLRSQVSNISAYDDTISMVGVRLNLAQTTLGRVSDIAHSIKSDALSTNSTQSNGTLSQASAYSELGEVLGLLNTQAGDRYLFSGRASDTPSVETFDHIMNGDGARAGFNQVVSERKQADLGNGLGRLNITPGSTSTSVQVAEDAVSPFGFKLASVNSSLTGATVTGPSGSPAVVSVDLGPTNPNPGDSIQFRFNLPDGTSENVTLTATTSSPPGPGEFTIGATSDVTAGNLQAALTASVGKLADTSLTAASAVAAGNDFFGNPPMRVSGVPLTGATALVAGTAANTVMWYTGENGPDPARGTATARVDNSISVSYGMRANEQGIRWVVQNIATLAAVTFSPTDPNANARAAALNQRIGSNLDVPAGTQKVEDIESEIAGAQTTLQTASDRHQQTKSSLQGLLDQIETVPDEQVASEILALQTRLQASLQTTSLLYKTSLVNFL